MDLEHLDRALANAGLGVFEWDARRDTVVISPRMAAITGFPAGPLQGARRSGLARRVHPDDRGRFIALRDAIVGGSRVDVVQFRLLRPDNGEVVWVRAGGSVKIGEDGAVLGVILLVQDITAYKREEEQRQSLLVELDHRVKNVLATVQVLAMQTAKRTTSLEVFLQTFGGRLKAMASANELLTAARWRGAAVEHLVAAELGAVAAGQATWEGPELFLTPRAANALSLALHELSANAMKHGALSTDSGHVDIRWSPRPEGGFELTWSETGGPSVEAPSRQGFGSTVMDQVAGRELHGESSVEYRPSGVLARLRAGPAAIAPRPQTLPAPPPRPAETQLPASGAVDLRGARVLIVEDAVLLALELELGLSDAGARVVGTAYDLDEALTLADQPLDAAVLDANLNGRSVAPVAELLTRRGVPFVFATGYGEAGGAPGDFPAPVIRKPYDVTQVAAAVAALLRAR